MSLSTYARTGRHEHDWRYFSTRWDRCCICNGWRKHEKGRFVPKLERGKPDLTMTPATKSRRSDTSTPRPGSSPSTSESATPKIAPRNLYDTLACRHCGRDPRFRVNFFHCVYTHPTGISLFMYLLNPNVSRETP